MRYHIKIYIIISVLATFLVAQPVIKVDHTNWDPSSVPGDSLNAVRSQIILFGHQSVGGNIVEGLFSLSQSDPGRYGLTFIRNIDDVNQPALYDWYNGQNLFPYGKVDSFYSALHMKNSQGEMLGNVADIAFFKFCFVDFNSRDIDPQDLFNYYKTKLEAIRSEFPKLKIIYITAPLYMLKYSGDSAANVRRHTFNQLLREYVAQIKGILFDLADLESHDDAGNAIEFTYNGSTYPLIWYVPSDPRNQGWSIDGGHLNDKGKEHMALAMWNILCKVAALEQSPVSIHDNQDIILQKFVLKEPYPNPANSSVVIPFTVNETQSIKIEIYSIEGKKIVTLSEKNYSPGNYKVSWNGTDSSDRDLPTGLYVLKVSGRDIQISKKIVLLK